VRVSGRAAVDYRSGRRERRYDRNQKARTDRHPGGQFPAPAGIEPNAQGAVAPAVKGSQKKPALKEQTRSRQDVPQRRSCLSRHARRRAGRHGIHHQQEKEPHGNKQQDPKDRVDEHARSGESRALGWRGRFFRFLLHRLAESTSSLLPSLLTYLLTFTCTPRRSMRIGSSAPPAERTAISTRGRASGSITSTRQPPPPAPQTLPPRAPCRRAAAMMRSIVGVEMVGRLRRRNSHSSRTRRPTSRQAPRRSAACTRRATSVICSRLRQTRRSPLMCALKTSQLLMPDCRGLPV